jgi:hypothetical protein
MEMPEEQSGCLGLLELFFGATLMLLLVVAVLL